MRAAFGRDVAQNGPHFDTGRNKRAGFQRLQTHDRLQIEGCVLRLNVHHLATSHAFRSTGQRQRRHQLAAHKWVAMGIGIGQDFKSERVQRVTGQNRGRFVKGPMHGGLATAQIIIIHAGKIVMYQRIDVNGLNRRTNAQSGFAVDIEQGCGGRNQQRTKTLAAANRCVPHGCI